jgi:SAM-dependent MidA family methyltransferase
MTLLSPGPAWIPFDEFMQYALYDPQTGYYTVQGDPLSTTPGDSDYSDYSGDFVTAPVLSPYFSQALVVQLRQFLTVTQTHSVLEFGAGHGELAAQLLPLLGDAIERYEIMEVSGRLKASQAARLAALPAHLTQKVKWLDHLPDRIEAVILGNELLDAMPVKLLSRYHDQPGVWFERGVIRHSNPPTGQHAFTWQDQPTSLHPPCAIEGTHDYVTEIHPWAQAWMRTVGARLQRGGILLIDYGFSESEYYHPQRVGGTLACHSKHRVDFDPLQDVGRKDLTAHVNFSDIARTACEIGLSPWGYTTQAWFLMNCGFLDLLQTADWAARRSAQKLIVEHEMGALFKVIALGSPDLAAYPWQGFVQGNKRMGL